MASNFRQKLIEKNLPERDREGVEEVDEYGVMVCCRFIMYAGDMKKMV